MERAWALGPKGLVPPTSQESQDLSFLTSRTRIVERMKKSSMNKALTQLLEHRKCLESDRKFYYMITSVNKSTAYEGRLLDWKMIT